MDVFAGVPVRDLPQSVAWFERLLGDVASFEPNAVERVWTLTDHGHVYVVVAPDDAGHGHVTLFVDDLGDFLASTAERGVEPDSQETYDNGVREGGVPRPRRQRGRSR
ncbi:hypothetical protein, partial [Gordonia rhizosphera]